METKLYYTATEVQEMLGVSRGKAYQIIKELNEKLEARGFIVIAGKISRQYLNEHYYGLAEQSNTNTTKSA